MPRSRSPIRRSSRDASMVTPVKKSGTPSKRTKGPVSNLISTKHAYTLATIQYLVSTLVVALIFTYGTLKFGVVSRFICPLVNKLYLVPLGLGLLKGRGLIFLSLGWYSLVTYLLMPVICNVAIPLCCGCPTDVGNPRTQKSQLRGCCARLACAQLNMVEGLVLLIGTVLVSFSAGIHDETILEVVTFYNLTRKLYIVAYAMDMSSPRTMMYLSGVLSCLYLYYLAISKFL